MSEILSQAVIDRIKKACHMTQVASFGDRDGPAMPFDIIDTGDILMVIELLETQTRIAVTLAQHLANSTDE